MEFKNLHDAVLQQLAEDILDAAKAGVLNDAKVVKGSSLPLDDEELAYAMKLLEDSCDDDFDFDLFGDDEGVEVTSLHQLIDRVTFVKPRTIVFWADGTKTVVTANGEEFDEEKGILMAYYKRFFDRNYYKDLTDIIANATVSEPKKRNETLERKRKSNARLSRHLMRQMLTKKAKKHQ